MVPAAREQKTSWSSLPLFRSVTSPRLPPRGERRLGPQCRRLEADAVKAAQLREQRLEKEAEMSEIGTARGT
jgi:hypothetical protein